MLPDQTKTHKKGRVAPGKVNRNWRILVGVDEQLETEWRLRGMNSKADFVNSLLVRYFNGEIIQREP